MHRSSRIAFLLMLALLLVGGVLMAGCTQTQPLTVRLADHPTYGTILTDSNGRSLYIIARDIPNTGIIADLGDVARFYPPFYAESMPGERGINTSEFGILTRPDGKKQTTFRGWPLYYYLNDRSAGEAKSQGANNITFLARPGYTVMVHENASQGIYLTTPEGLTLYASDTPNVSGEGMGYVPFHAATIDGPSPVVLSGDFSQVTGANGSLQTAYQGRPLSIFSGDRAPGVISGVADGFQPVVLAPTGSLSGLGEAPTAAPSPTKTSAAAGPSPTAGGVATTARTAATTAAASVDDPYTGGVYTPTPFRTVRVVSDSTETVTPGVTWTPVPTGTVSTPVPSGSPTTTAPPTSLTPAPTQTAVPASTTAAPTTLSTTAPSTTVPTLPPTTVSTTAPTTAPTTVSTTVPAPEPTTQATTIATTLPNPLPISTIPTLPPFPAVSDSQGTGNAS